MKDVYDFRLQKYQEWMDNLEAIVSKVMAPNVQYTYKEFKLIQDSLSVSTSSRLIPPSLRHLPSFLCHPSGSLGNKLMRGASRPIHFPPAHEGSKRKQSLHSNQRHVDFWSLGGSIMQRFFMESRSRNVCLTKLPELSLSTLVYAGQDKIYTLQPYSRKRKEDKLSQIGQLFVFPSPAAPTKLKTNLFISMSSAPALDHDSNTNQKHKQLQDLKN